MLETGKPLFGICLGHQLLGLAVGARTAKMHQGHRGANHPVKRLADGRVEITSMNHGFAVEADSLPDNARPTHISLFDGSLCGLELTDRPAFSVQYHPEASPGPQDSAYLFGKFVDTAAVKVSPLILLLLAGCASHGWSRMQRRVRRGARQLPSLPAPSSNAIRTTGGCSTWSSASAMPRRSPPLATAARLRAAWAAERGCRLTAVPGGRSLMRQPCAFFSLLIVAAIRHCSRRGRRCAGQPPIAIAMGRSIAMPAEDGFAHTCEASGGRAIMSACWRAPTPRSSFRSSTTAASPIIAISIGPT